MNASLLSTTATFSGHTFIPDPLNAGSVVFDLGANQGSFASQVLQRFGCRCIAVEAAPMQVERLRQIPRLQVVHAAVNGDGAEVTFHVSDDSLASNMFRPTSGHESHPLRVAGVTLQQLFAMAGDRPIDLVKVDIEGAELPAITSTPTAELARVRQMSIEHHDFCGLTTAADLQAMSRKLAEAGLVELRFGPANTNTLYVNRAPPCFGRLRERYLRACVVPFMQSVYIPARSGWHVVRDRFRGRSPATSERAS